MYNSVIKDILPFLGTIMTIIAAYIGISKKIREDRKAKWIEDFRNEISQFTFNIMVHSSNYASTFNRMEKVINSGNLILLYLNPQKKTHIELQDLIVKATILIVKVDNKTLIETYPDLNKKIIDLARLIIIEEETAIK